MKSIGPDALVAEDKIGFDTMKSIGRDALVTDGKIGFNTNV